VDRFELYNSLSLIATRKSIVVQTHSTRCFLFLQGVNSPFFAQLGLALHALGHGVVLINFNQGDRWYRAKLERVALKTINHRFGTGESLEQLLTAVFREFGITDQIVFGDRRPIHMQAMKQAKLAGIRTHVFEEGYFRPYFVTLEQGGVNARSDLPREIDWYARAAAALPAGQPAPPQSFSAPFWRRAMHDVWYHVAGAQNLLRYPGYQSHSLETAPREYLGYVKRYVRTSLRRQDDHQCVHDVIAQGKRFYFLPLQLDGDFQVRDHLRLHSMRALLEHVLQSFATHAPKDTSLVIKNHPLDSGAVDLEKRVATLSRDVDLQQRVLYLEKGDVDLITKHAAGTVTLNSTVGAVALSNGCPTLALGEAIYNMAGLTDQNGLENFWRHPLAADPVRFKQFKQVVLSTIQINGGFYSPQGIALAVNNSLEVLLAEESRLQALLARVPVCAEGIT
jgi:capsular polysaccharide export protein